MGVSRLPMPTLIQVAFAGALASYAEATGLRDAVDFPDPAEPHFDPFQVDSIRPNGRNEDLGLSLEAEYYEVRSTLFVKLVVYSRFLIEHIEILEGLVITAFHNIGLDTIQRSSVQVDSKENTFTVLFRCRR